jgi:hypothetical protein
VLTKAQRQVQRNVLRALEKVRSDR